MRPLSTHILIVVLLVSLLSAAGAAQETGISRGHHPWGCFQEGTWKRVRVVTETFEENETLVSTTETRTTLQELTEEGVTLLVERVVEVGGKPIPSKPQTITQGWYGELTSRDVKVSHLGAGEVAIQGLRIPCKIQQLEVSGPASKTTTKIYYSDTVEPFILKRESVETDLEGTTRLGETTVEVMEVDVPCRILANIIRNSFHVKAVHKDPKGMTTTVAFTSTRVPGGVIRHNSKQFDADGRLVRQSSLELLDYGLEAAEDRPGWLGHRRPARIRPPRRFAPYRLEPLPDHRP
ncbi:MAG: hypothetical protein ABIK89_02355 [Planctomycetota bacterium]